MVILQVLIKKFEGPWSDPAWLISMCHLTKTSSVCNYIHSLEDMNSFVLKSQSSQDIQGTVILISNLSVNSNENSGFWAQFLILGYESVACLLVCKESLSFYKCPRNAQTYKRYRSDIVHCCHRIQTQSSALKQDLHLQSQNFSISSQAIYPVTNFEQKEF